MLTPHFCNVDLEIESRTDLAALKAELARKVVILFEGPVRPGCFLLTVEPATRYDNADDTIHAFCSLLERLSPKGRKAWRIAYKKEFDVGYEAVLSQPASQFSLRTETLQRMSKLGATLGVTFYHHKKARNASTKPD